MDILEIMSKIKLISQYVKNKYIEKEKNDIDINKDLYLKNCLDSINLNSKFIELSYYDKCVVCVLILDLDDDNHLNIHHYIYNKNPKIKDFLFNNFKHIDTEFNNNILYDYKDVGCYVKHINSNFVFKIYKRDFIDIYDKNNNIYRDKDCVPISLKELRDYKISLL